MWITRKYSTFATWDSKIALCVWRSSSLGNAPNTSLHKWHTFIIGDTECHLCAFLSLSDDALISKARVLICAQRVLKTPESAVYLGLCRKCGLLDSAQMWWIRLFKGRQNDFYFRKHACKLLFHLYIVILKFDSKFEFPGTRKTVTFLLKKNVYEWLNFLGI